MFQKIRYTFALCMLTGLAVNTWAQQESDLTKLKNFFTNIALYHKQFTQEKVYLHIDNNGYFPGETIWFKAYVVNAGSLLPTDMSKVLYVELLTPEGQVLQRKTFPVKNGRTYGEFHLEDIIHTGFYEVRAYTRAMLNWDAAYAFSRVIPIYEPPKDSLNYGKLTMFQPDEDKDSAIPRPAAQPLTAPGVQKSGSCLLEFYPEGGSLVKGLPSRVAYRIIDKKGMPLEAKCALCRADGTALTSSQPLHEGMGLLEVPADGQEGHVKVMMPNGKEVQFPLPQAEADGCAMQVNHEGDSLIIDLHGTPEFCGRLLGLSVTCRGTICYLDTLRPGPDGKARCTVPRRLQRGGIQQITAFTPEGRILAERLAWIKPLKAPMQFHVAQNKTAYGAFEPIVLDFTLTDAKGKPQRGEFSLAVRDADGELGKDGADIGTDLLLSSDLKGYIHRPEYYFEADDADHRRALDLLMMVQGWRRYRWQEMAGTEPFQLKQPVEDGILVDGRVVDNSSKHRGKEGIDVNLMLQLGTRVANGSTISDKDGKFAILAPTFYDDALAFFTTTVNDKRQACNVSLNRLFSPAPLAYEPQELLFQRSPEPQDGSIAQRRMPDIFQWKDTLPNIIHLPEVKVKDKNYFPKYGSRFTWQGGEEAGKKFATLYYNIEDELEKVFDDGDRDPSLWDWLAKKNPHLIVEYPTINSYSVHNRVLGERNQALGDFIPSGTSSLSPNAPLNPIFNEGNHSGFHSPANPILQYRGRPVRILVDNARPVGDIDFLMSDIRSLIICERPSVINRFVSGHITDSGRPHVLFLLYSRIDKSLTKYKKGQRITVVHGYSKYEEFFSPDYRRVDTPTSEDTRRTLYWSPNVTTDEQGKAHVILFSNCRPKQHICVNAQGMAVTGQLFSHRHGTAGTNLQK